jgi:hypothetical protein
MSPPHTFYIVCGGLIQGGAEYEEVTAVFENRCGNHRLVEVWKYSMLN